MTREEAIKILNKYDLNFCDIDGNPIPPQDLAEAFDMAIEALESEPSEDCISREYLKSFGYINKGNFNSVETIREWIDNAPSVIPKAKEGKWIAKDGIFYCSCCDNDSAGLSEEDVYLYEFPLPNYCPNCGARMEDEEECNVI